MSTGQRVPGARVRSTVNYVRNPPSEGASPLEFVTEDESRSTMETVPGQEVWVRDARPLPTDLDREGFVLVQHASSVVDFDAIEEEAAVDDAYTAEMTELLREVTGASFALMLGGGKKRHAERAVEKLAPLANAKPARYPHADNTDTSAVGLVDMIARFVPDLDLESYSRWALYNMWRCVSPPPQDVPLAVCDARSVRADDELTVVAVTTVRGSGDLRHDTTGYLHSPAHRWHYYPNLTAGEVVVFKAHDSDPQRAGRVPHTAFDDATCPDDAPPRASVEMRGLALFA
ncbi:MAG TPA: CmcJ/NvfI family oxidoreductase [Acidimicrobiales bacterium]